jgi:hypothetical protein
MASMSARMGWIDTDAPKNLQNLGSAKLPVELPLDSPCREIFTNLITTRKVAERKYG